MVGACGHKAQLMRTRGIPKVGTVDVISAQVSLSTQSNSMCSSSQFLLPQVPVLYCAFSELQSSI